MKHLKRVFAILMLASLIGVTGGVSASYAETTKPAAVKEAVKKETGYVASKEGGKYHNPSCSAAAKIKPENKVTFSSKAKAEKAGYQPCGICKP